MWRTIYVATLSVALGMSAHAADIPTCKLEKFGELPVTMSDSQPLISGTVNGIDAKFLADSGAFYSMLSAPGAAKLQLKAEESRVIMVSGVGGIEPAGVTKVKRLTLDGLNPEAIENVEFIVSYFGPGYGYGTVGLIGQNLIGRADTEYDLANGVIRLYRSVSCGKRPLDYWNQSGVVGAIAIDKTTVRSPHFVGTARLNGTKIRVMFDTGASRSMVTRRAAAKAGVDIDATGVTENGYALGAGGAAKTWLAKFDLLDLGGEQISNVRLRIVDTKLGGMADMILGADFFLSHRIYIAKDQRIIYFTYNGGRVFNLTAPSAEEQASAEAGAAPVDGTNQTVLKTSDEYRRRGAASMNRMEYVSAMSDFEQAIKLAPTAAENYHQRALAHLELEKRELALQDYDRAIALNAENAVWLTERGKLHFDDKNAALAKADFDAAVRSATNDAGLALNIAARYQQEGLYDDAIHFLDFWIAAHPLDNRLPIALNDRCWARAEANKELDLALADCNRAIELDTRAQFFDSRGLVYLRLGRFAEAIDDYNAALRRRRNEPSSLYGLGLATIRSGKKEKGEKYLQSAIRLNKSVADEYKKIELEP